MHSETTAAPLCFLESDPHLSLVRRGAAEFTGTLLLVLVIMGTHLNALLAVPSDRGTSVFVGAVVAGGALAGLILVLGTISGGHFNPLITILQWMSRLRNLNCAVAYVVAQLSGGVAGALLATVAFGTADPSGGPRSPLAGWMLAEILSSASLMIVVFGALKSSRREFGSLAVGAWLTASVIGLPPAFANPALALGTKLAMHTNTMTWRALLLAGLMEIAGALLAIAIVSFLFPPQTTAAQPTSIAPKAVDDPAGS